jgi:hypothetical protein
MDRFQRQAVLGSIVLLEYLMVVGFIVAAVAWAYSDPAVFEGWLAIGATFLVIGVVAPGFLCSLVVMVIRDYRAHRRGRTPSNDPWAIVGQATVTAVLGGLLAVLATPLLFPVIAQMLLNP